MNLVPTPVTDKNGRRTVVHKRGAPTVRASGVRLAAAAPTVAASPEPRSRVDEPFTMTTDGYSDTTLLNHLNEKHPERRLDYRLGETYDLAATSRDIYSLIRHGVSVRHAVYLCHFGLAGNIHEVRQTYREIGEAPGGDSFWVDELIRRDIPVAELQKAIVTGLPMTSLRGIKPSIAADMVEGYGYKVFGSPEASLLRRRVMDGVLDWADIRVVGVTRSVKNASVIGNFLGRNAKERTGFTAGVIKEAIVEAEQRPRGSFRLRLSYPSAQITDYLSAYKSVGGRVRELNMADLVVQLREVHHLTDPDEMFVAAAYCDELIHRVRSDVSLRERIAEAIGSTEMCGHFEGQYERGTTAHQSHRRIDEPDWKIDDLLRFRDFGITIDDAIDALAQGRTPHQTAGIVNGGTHASIAEGWL